MIDGSVLPEGYEVVEVHDGTGGYEYVVQSVEEDFAWCDDSSHSDVFDTLGDFDENGDAFDYKATIREAVEDFWADEDAQDPKWGEHKI